MFGEITKHLSNDRTIRFGTDGWRAVIGDLYTIENLRIIAQAIADYLHEISGDSAGVAVGYDTRFMSPEFAGVVAQVLAANKIPVLLSSDVIPTPILSYTVKHHQLQAGIMLTASHNPYFYHGLKFKAPYGGPANIGMTNHIEKLLFNRAPLAADQKTSSYIKITDFFPAYYQHVTNLLDLKRIRRYRQTIYFDAMYGAGQDFMQKLLSGTQVRIETLHSERNPIFGGLYPEPILKNMQALKHRIADHPGNLGIATDGDADRFGVLDHKGNFIALHELLALMFTYLWDVRGWRGQVVRSTSMADSVDIPAKQRGTGVAEVPVGFKNITDEMITHPTIIGAEESGGFGYGVHIPERDGLLSALLLIEMLGHYGSDLPELLNDLRKETGERAYDRIDFYHPAEQLQKRLAEIKTNLPDRIGNYRIRSVDEKDGIKFHFDNGAWMLIRLSATEPMARIYVTAAKPAEVQELLAAGSRMMRDEG